MTRRVGLQQRFRRFKGDAISVAIRLLGQRLVRVIDGERAAGIITEVEAYLGAEDKASHTYGGRRTRRNASMYLPAGHAYVYFTYGMHHCMNVVCGEEGVGTAVLVRAIQPTEGLRGMATRRKAAKSEVEFCSGPARLTQALAINRSLDGEDLRTSNRLFIEEARKRVVPNRQILVTRRIGVAYADEWAEAPLRFVLRDSPYVSRRGWK